MRKILFLLLLIFSVQGAVYACTCLHTDINVRDFIETPFIFAGTATNIKLIENEPYEEEVTFSVIKLYKGSMETSSVKLITSIGGGDCGLPIKVGQTWVIWAWISNGVLRSGLCTHSKMVQQAGKDLKYLDKFSKNGLEWTNADGVVARGKIENNTVDGVWRFFNNGIVSDEIVYDFGKVISEKKYNEKGLLIRYFTRKNTGLYDGDIIYWSNGKIRQNVRLNGLREVSRKYYHENGKLAYSEELKATDKNPFGKEILMYNKKGDSVNSDDYHIEFDPKKNEYVFKKLILDNQSSTYSKISPG